MIFWKGVRYMIEWLTIAVGVLGGLCLFLYGMKGMGEGLEKVAGTKMQQIIESLTGNIVKGILVGAVVTAIIQSSSATTVMVVGFVSAGIMTLKQAVGVIKRRRYQRFWFDESVKAGFFNVCSCDCRYSFNHGRKT